MRGRILANRVAVLGLGLCIGLVLVVLAKGLFGADQAASAGAIADAEAAFSNKDYATSLNLLRPLAEKGDAKAQHGLATHYKYGLGVDQDNAKAINWEILAATKGYVKAQSALGAILLNGDLGIRHDDKQAMIWFQQAADQGDADGQFYVGFMYGAGRGFPQDDEEAMNWYRKAAELDSAYAQYTLGVIYTNGRGVPRSSDEALNWFRKAWKNGDENMKKASTEMIASIELDAPTVTQLLSNLNVRDLKMLMNVMSIMNCGQSIGTKYSMKNFIQDKTFYNTPWPQSIEIATKIATAKCGEAKTQTKLTLF